MIARRLLIGLCTAGAHFLRSPLLISDIALLRLDKPSVLPHNRLRHAAQECLKNMVSSLGARITMTARRSIARLRALPKRMQLILLSLALMLVVVLAGTAVALDNTPDDEAMGGGQTFHRAGLPAPAIAAITQQQWLAAGPPFAQAIAFASSEPLTALACGSLKRNGMALGASQDGGKTWQAYSLPITGQDCALAFDATNAKLVALQTRTCAKDCAELASYHLYSSRDGGVRWAEISLPEGAAPGMAFGWVGGALTVSTTDAAHPFAVSRDGAAFQFADDITRFGGTVTQISATTDRLIAVLRGKDGILVPVQTTTDGQVWSLANLTDQAQPVTLRGDMGGKLLVGTEAHDTVVVSRDGGLTWVGEPLPVGRFVGTGTLLAAPDGMIIAPAVMADQSSDGLYLLAPGATSWVKLGDGLSEGTTLSALSWDASGHPLALWALTRDENTTLSQALLAYIL